MGSAAGNSYVDDQGRLLVSRLVLRGASGPLRFQLPLRTILPVALPSPPPRALIDDLHALVSTIGGFQRAVRPGDTVVLKPNFNSGDPWRYRQLRRAVHLGLGAASDDRISLVEADAGVARMAGD